MHSSQFKLIRLLLICRCRGRLQELGFPTLPQIEVTAEDVPEAPILQRRLADWATENALDSDNDLFVLKPAIGSTAEGIELSAGVEEVADVAAQLLAEASHTF